ncbi:Molybdate transporter of MFS superfamily protein [Roseivivax marinus]|uniref:putative sulfate/molybdate transporter n=1 Tax=Roseivivax marinus TaxID=1379903 RepID=UPI0008CBC831|nr:putative sulfate/molybdate transporter [Roseivivax marinus]SEL59448.1 Molybdate transporter of MFS superfamily protein [Roseivivax marinus]
MTGERHRWTLAEFNGALGDTGTLLPLLIGAITVGGMSPIPVLLGFALAYLVTGLVYRLPVPVQPMKAIAALVMVTEVTPEAVAMAGLMIGAVLVLLGATGAIDRLARLVPRSIIAGLRLGLGLSLAWIALGLMMGDLAMAAAAVALLAVARCMGAPSAFILITAGAIIAAVSDAPVNNIQGAWQPDWVIAPNLSVASDALTDIVLPQLALTLTNAVIVTALVAGELFGTKAAQVTPRRLCLSSGLLNCALAPFGALPMCHGAGGLAAHNAFGARSGAAVLMMGGLLAIATLSADTSTTLLVSFPESVLGVLLLVAAIELAKDRRLTDSRPSCYPVIGITAVICVVLDPFSGLVAGTVAEFLRKWVLHHMRLREQ